MENSEYEACDALLNSLEDEDCSTDLYTEESAEQLDVSAFDIFALTE